jgi:F0F1-type ATP synthase assembly protein I
LRATHALTHGRLLAAFQFHPGYILSLPTVGFLLFLWLREWRRHGEMPVPLAQNECNKPLVWIAVIFIALGVVRNIPIAPFNWLASPPVVEPAAVK